MTSHVIAYRSTELLFRTHKFNFNCFFDDFNCVFTQIRCLSRLLPVSIFGALFGWTALYLSLLTLTKFYRCACMINIVVLQMILDTYLLCAKDWGQLFVK